MRMIGGQGSRRFRRRSEGAGGGAWFSHEGRTTKLNRLQDRPSGANQCPHNDVPEGRFPISHRDLSGPSKNARELGDRSLGSEITERSAERVDTAATMPTGLPAMASTNSRPVASFPSVLLRHTVLDTRTVMGFVWQHRRWPRRFQREHGY